MKELSIEEKARRYDEAIKRAKSKIKKDKDHVLYEDDIIDIFPELAESEDEKNIKNLIDELKCSLRGATCQNETNGGGQEKRIALLEWAIAWLEKQGEKDEEILILKDQIESLHAARKALKEVHEIESEEQAEQKSTWDEEDEKMYSATIFALDGFMGNEDKLDWLKSLKYRVQPKQEWGEEDEKTLNNILSCIKYCQDEDTEAQYNGNRFVDPERYESMSDWLKHLKNRAQL